MKIVIIGGGSFGTALANQLSFNPENKVTLLMRNEAALEEINQAQTHSRFFPNQELNKRNPIRAVTDYHTINDAAVVIIAVPTKSIPSVAQLMKPYMNPNTLVVNMAKGILENGVTVVEFLKQVLRHDYIASLKGASFSAEMMHHTPTLLTLGFDDKSQLDLISRIVADTNIFVDHTTDIKGVELLSALKNIYAILLGHVDAQYNAVNTRFLILTKAIGEIKIILKALGGKEASLFLSCGIGDISLTSLNDLSRNRTLGLLIGKGFYNASFSDNAVVLEGVKTLSLIDAILAPELKGKLPLFNELSRLFISREQTTLHLDFNRIFNKRVKTVLTYGSFDLLHFGHLEILRRAKELGDHLVVGLSTDEFNNLKGKTCEIPFEKRKQFLESISYVDAVIPEHSWDQKVDDVSNYHVDLFVMGDDWEGKFDFLKPYCEVRYLPRTPGISTTILKSIIR